MFGPTRRQWFLAAVLCVLAALTALPARAAALEPALVQGLAGDFNARVAAIDALGVAGGDEAAALLDALEGGRLGTVGGRLVVLMEPIWVHWDQSHALEWPLPRPALTTEFQLCLHENHLRARCALQMSKKAVVRRGVT